MKKLFIVLIIIAFAFTSIALKAEAKKVVKKVKIVKKVSVCDTIVYVKAKGKKYHKKNCKLVKKDKKGITLREALKAGFTPCSICKPVTKPITKPIKKKKEIKKSKEIKKAIKKQKEIKVARKAAKK